MKANHEIAKEFTAKPIAEIAKLLGVQEQDILFFGRDIAKIHLNALKKSRSNPKPNKLILISATTPTAAGEGKTTTTIGLGQAFTQLGESVCLALREPSLGPCLGVKGGATGGGYSQIMPADRINLHFTGDFHAITTVNNLIAASLGNHIYQGNELNIDSRQITWRRVMDMNDRSLRHIMLGLGGKTQGTPREGGFDITAASEVMAMLCLANDMQDLRTRLDRTLIAYTFDDKPIYVKDLEITGALMALLREAMHPNLVQAFEGTPVFVHGGPFANIAHGCNSVLATRMAMHFSEWTITEAGFGFDLGAEKFFDIKCRTAGLDPDVVVLVTTIRALKLHGGKNKSQLDQKDVEAVTMGLANLDKHIENVAKFNKVPVVALNRFYSDTDEEIAVVKQRAENHGVYFAESRHFAEGGKGAIDLAKKVMEAASKSQPYKPLYPLEMAVNEKIKTICKEIYGADDVSFTKDAEKDLRHIKNLGLEHLPVCIAKAPSSLSDDPSLHGRPRDFQVTVRGIEINTGAGFLVVLTGNILRMPGLPKDPMAKHIDLLPDGTIVGVG